MNPKLTLLGAPHSLKAALTQVKKRYNGSAVHVISPFNVS
jgi:hypothetical protein